jgi:branched-chain amino acid transport system substrate-binding protein
LADEHSGGGVRAFLIADVRGYTSFTQERGDVEAARLASRFASLVRECVHAAGGRVVELRGDEALCVFGSPRQALQTGIVLQRTFADATREDPSLPMRVGIGIDAGEAVAVEGGFRGAALNLAARLCALAGPGEVLVGEGILLMAGRVDGLAYADRGRVRVKGVSEPVRVRRLEFDLDLPAAEPQQRFGKRARLVLAAVGLAVAGAAVGAFLIVRGGGGEPLEVVGDSAALLDPASGRLAAQFPVGATPVAVVSDDSAAWTLDADGETISRVDPAGERPLTKAAPATPTGLALGGDLLWVAFAERGGKFGGIKVGVAGLDPVTLSSRLTPTVLPGIGPNSGDVPAVAYAAGAVWVSGPDDLLRKIEPASGRVTASLRLGDGVFGLASGLGSLWATAGRDKVVQIDPAKARIIKRTRLPTPGVGPVAVGAGAVWVADPFAGVLWKIRPGATEETRTVTIGLSASGVAYGGGAIWVASGVDGKVARVNTSTEQVTTFSLGNAPLAVSVARAGVWMAVAAAGGRSTTATPKLLGLDTLPAGTCSSAVYGGSGRPDALIVSDLPTQSVEIPVSLAMVQAIELVLRRHHFRAGRFRIAYQACDDATVAAGSFTAEKCASNAKMYAAAAAVIGVIGPENSGCATAQIGITNRARAGPLAMVSPTASYVGLTRQGPGVSPHDPDRFYPTGIRNFMRVFPPDDAQGAAGALLAKRLHVRRVYVFESDPRESYGAALAGAFVKAARALGGIRFDGPHSPSPKHDKYRSLARRLRSDRIGAIYIAGFNDERAAALIRAARDAIGARLVLIGPDAFLPASNLVHDVGKAAIGMYVTGGVVSDPANQLPPAGQRFVSELSKTQSRRNVSFYAPYAAQAAEVLLQAIAHSDGTRASVTRELLGVRIQDGILGSFEFDPSGEPTASLFPIFRVTPTAPEVLYPADRVVDVIAAPLQVP